MTLLKASFRNSDFQSYYQQADSMTRDKSCYQLVDSMTEKRCHSKEQRRISSFVLAMTCEILHFGSKRHYDFALFVVGFVLQILKRNITSLFKTVSSRFEHKIGNAFCL